MKKICFNQVCKLQDTTLHLIGPFVDFFFALFVLQTLNTWRLLSANSYTEKPVATWRNTNRGEKKPGDRQSNFFVGHPMSTGELTMVTNMYRPLIRSDTFPSRQKIEVLNYPMVDIC